MEGLGGPDEELVFQCDYIGDDATGSEERAVRVGEDDQWVPGSLAGRDETLAEAGVGLRIASGGIFSNASSNDVA